MSFHPFKSSATSIAAAVNCGELDPRELATNFVNRTENLQETLNTHIAWDKDEILRRLEPQLDYLAAAKQARKPLPLAGVPIVVKDNIAVRGHKLSCGSQLLDNFRSPYDAEVVTRLRKAGALLLGKTNLDEFGMGSSNENSAFGPVKNPWNTHFVPGGSSGGSAAAVAAGMAPLALGSDTGGSIRQPAAFCGIVGLKPTYGAVSRYGLVSYASSLDQVGPLARTVEDLWLLFRVIAGPDTRDSTSQLSSKWLDDFQLSANATPGETDPQRLDGLKVGVVEEFLAEGTDPEVLASVQASRDALEELGAEVTPCSLPSLRHALASYYIIATAEASSNLARYDGIRYGNREQSPGAGLESVYSKSRTHGFGKEVKKRIMLGTFSLSSGYYDAYYHKATQVRRLIRNEIDQALRQFDVLIGATTPTTAFRLGSKMDDSMSMYRSDVDTIVANLGGHPALSIPCGQDQQGLPIGLQMMAGHFQEAQLLRVAHAFESKTRWCHDNFPRC